MEWLDLVPKPLRAIPERLGIDEHYCRTYVVLTTRTIRFEDLATPQYARPLAFLGGSCALCATLCLAGISWSALWHQLGDVGNLAFKTLAVEWLASYCAILVVSLLAIHADMLTLHFFKARESPPITYSYRLRVLTYLWAWAMPLGMLLAAAEVALGGRIGTQDTNSIMRISYLPIWFRQYTLLNVWYDFDIRKMTRWNWYTVRWLAAMCGAILSINLIALASEQPVVFRVTAICVGVLVWRRTEFLTALRSAPNAIGQVKDVRAPADPGTQGPNEVVE